jgi:hypothetical protein
MAALADGHSLALDSGYVPAYYGYTIAQWSQMSTPICEMKCKFRCEFRCRFKCEFRCAKKCQKKCKKIRKKSGAPVRPW